MAAARRCPTRVPGFALHCAGHPLYKRLRTPRRHKLEAWLHEYIEGAQLGDGKRHLLRAVAGTTGRLAGGPMPQVDVSRMVGRRAKAASIQTRIGRHCFRATGRLNLPAM
jgi:hypothetical protein